MAKRVTRETMRRGWRRQGLRTRLGLLGGFYAGLVLCLYTFAGGRHVFMERPLSINHRGYENNCGNCHRAFEGVTDERCATTCHSENYMWSEQVDLRLRTPGIPYRKEIHYYAAKFDKKKDCLACHPAECHSRDLKKEPRVPMPPYGVQCETNNQENLVLPRPLAENTCKSCHDECPRSTRCYHCHEEHRDGMPITLNRPEDVFAGTPPAPLALMTPRGRLQDIVWTEQTALNFDRTRGRMNEKNCMGCHPDVLHRKPPTPDDIDKSIISRGMFRHLSLGHRRYWHCNQPGCHLHKFPLERDRNENIFTMETCTQKCHYPDDCGGCHRFHDPINRPGEHVDWPERLTVYNRLIGTSETRLGIFGITTAESGPTTGEIEPTTRENEIATKER